jgi:hypothetical protein
MELQAQASTFYDQYPEARTYKRFTDMPQDKLNEGFIISWLMFEGALSQVPNELRTERMKRIAVRCDTTSFKHISPDEVADYKALIVDAVENSLAVAKEIKPEHLTEDLIIKIAERRLIVLGYLKLDSENNHLLTDALISSVVKRSVSSAVYLNRTFGKLALNRMSDDDIKVALQERFSEVGGLVQLGKEYVLAELIKSGYWPDVNEKRQHDKDESDVTRKYNHSSPPISPVDAMLKLTDFEAAGYRLLYLQSLKLFPIEEVITTTVDIANAPDILLQAYSEPELKPHMKLSRALRGRLLETGLGL